MIDKVLGMFQQLVPKFTRWDGISMLIFLTLAYVTESGFRVVGNSFRDLLVLVGMLFIIALLLLIIEPALKRLP